MNNIEPKACEEAPVKSDVVEGYEYILGASERINHGVALLEDRLGPILKPAQEDKDEKPAGVAAEKILCPLGSKLRDDGRSLHYMADRIDELLYRLGI